LESSFSGSLDLYQKRFSDISMPNRADALMAAPIDFNLVT